MCKMFNHVFIVAIITMSAIACQGQQANTKGDDHTENEDAHERMIQTNRRMLDQERSWIEAYIEENNWSDSMVSMGNGGYIQFLEKTEGERIVSKQDVYFLCSAELLDGTDIYKTEIAERTWKVDRTDGELGLHDALKKMAVGERARVILPSYQAFGLAGDLDEVPPRAPILYTLEIIDVR